MMMLEKVEMQPGAAPAAFPSPIFAGSGSVSWFLSFLLRLLRERLGVINIVGFRSRRTPGD